MQSIRITSRPTSGKKKWNQLSQFRRTSTKVIPIEDLGWPNFGNEPRVQEKLQKYCEELGTLGMPYHGHQKRWYLLQGNFDSYLHAKN